MSTAEKTVEGLNQDNLKRAVEGTDVPVELMHKTHKLSVVRSLKKSGMFTLRNAVERVAEELDVSRFTIYNYLNEVENESQAMPRGQ